MPVSEATYRQLSLEDDDTTWELVCGRLREKPPMTYDHGDTASYLNFLLQSALRRAEFRVSQNHARLRLPDGQYFVPDLAVVPQELRRRFRGVKDAVEEYSQPLPLVVEVWSPSTGKYDAREKIAGYRERGDREIWLIDPYEISIAVHRRTPGGEYVVLDFAAGDVIEPASLPGVRIDVNELLG